MLKLGNTNINKAYLGSTEIKKMYLGNDIVFDNTAPTIYDPDFQAWIDYNILQGHYITSDTVKLNAANQYVIDSKADGTWLGKDVDFIFAWNDLQMDDASLVCLKRLVKATVYGGCTYTLNGWEGNAVDGYVDTNHGIMDGTNFTRFDAGKGALIYKEDISGNKVISSGGRNIFYNEDTDLHTLSSINNLNASADLTGTGLKTIYRHSSSSITLYNKNIQMGRTQSTNTPTNTNLLLFSSNSLYSDLGMSLYFLGKSFTQSENESMRTNLNTYLSAIGLTPIA